MNMINSAALLLSFALVMTTVYALWRTQLRPKPFGMANTITLARNVLVALIANILIFDYGAHENAIVFAIATVVLAMDGLDGYVARRLNICTDFGARFDMESDALFIMVLCAGIVVQFEAPYWVLLIGAMRYAYVFAQKVFDPLNLPVKDRYSRKVICVIQVVALTLPFSEMVPRGIWQWLVFIALMSLIFSFGRDIVDQINDFRRGHRHETV